MLYMQCCLRMDQILGPRRRLRRMCRRCGTHYPSSSGLPRPWRNRLVICNPRWRRRRLTPRQQTKSASLAQRQLKFCPMEPQHVTRLIVRCRRGEMTLAVLRMHPSQVRKCSYAKLAGAHLQSDPRCLSFLQAVSCPDPQYDFHCHPLRRHCQRQPHQGPTEQALAHYLQYPPQVRRKRASSHHLPAQPLQLHFHKDEASRLCAGPPRGCRPSCPHRKWQQRRPEQRRRGTEGIL
mmetsp:Transcript_22196/g.41306  ORF Transcript_22196/g.41306 Transcript_22196/m.41306 type:complete len:235 (+) Transcript_22196:969-1673(+)